MWSFLNFKWQKTFLKSPSSVERPGREVGEGVSICLVTDQWHNGYYIKKSIPVWCLPPACQPYPIVSHVGGGRRVDAHQSWPCSPGHAHPLIPQTSGRRSVSHFLTILTIILCRMWTRFLQGDSLYYKFLLLQWIRFSIWVPPVSRNKGKVRLWRFDLPVSGSLWWNH